MRGKKAPRRKIANDSKYNSALIGKFVNYVMYDGKKRTAERVVYDAFTLIEEKTQKPAIEIFDEAIKNVSPVLEVKSKRVGGANYQVPLQVRAERRVQLAFRWILVAARAKGGKPMAERLAEELILAAQNEGDAMKKRADVQRMAEANRAFAHFAR